MQDPEAYTRGNGSQIKSAQKLLSNYFHLINWKNEEEVVMDLGCGPGSITGEVLRKMLPENCGTIYAVDIEERMIEFGRKNHPRINFIQSDIGSAEFAARFRNSIEHVFSFSCFQWIQDQRQLMKNLFDILKPGDDILTFPGMHPVCDVYKKMLEIEKWKDYKEKLKVGILAYQFPKNVEEYLRELLTETGFAILMCKCENYTYVYKSLEELKNFLLGINPLQKHSKNIQEELVSDIVQDFTKMNIIQKNISPINVTKTLISFCARKSAEN